MWVADTVGTFQGGRYRDQWSDSGTVILYQGGPTRRRIEHRYTAGDVRGVPYPFGAPGPTAAVPGSTHTSRPPRPWARGLSMCRGSRPARLARPLRWSLTRVPGLCGALRWVPAGRDGLGGTGR